VRGPLYSRIAAASGIGFVALIATVACIGEVKDFPGFGDVAGASNEVFGTVTLLTGVAAILLVWFTSTFAARARQLEGASGRLSTTIAVSGAIIAGILALAVSIVFTARNGNSSGIAAIATGMVDGPAMFFPAAALTGAAGIVGMRADGLPLYSRILAWLSVPLSLAYVGGAGLMLFENYAWINDTGYITFLAFTLALSVIGVIRWAQMDEKPVTPEPEVEEEPAELLPARKPAPRAKQRVRRAS
jgi:hypothetical protein